MGVSTHASAGDATPLDRRTEAEKEFQLTRPRGTRLLVVIVRVDRDVFQLTRPRGTRRLRRDFKQSRLMFQLTRPRGTRRWCEKMCL